MSSFDCYSKKPQGLLYFDNAVDKDLSQEIYDWFMSVNFKKKLFPVRGGNKNSRKVMHFGYKYDYKSGSTIKKTEDMPNILLKLREVITRVWKDCDIDDDQFNQCIVNRYLPGQGIGKHIDKITYGKYVVGFTFISGRYFVFSRRGFNDYKIYTKHRSMYVMSGNSRYKWTHSMDKVKTDKVKNLRRPRQICYSVTFRHVPSAPKIKK